MGWDPWKLAARPDAAALVAAAVGADALLMAAGLAAAAAAAFGKMSAKPSPQRWAYTEASMQPPSADEATRNHRDPHPAALPSSLQGPSEPTAAAAAVAAELQQPTGAASAAAAAAADDDDDDDDADAPKLLSLQSRSPRAAIRVRGRAAVRPLQRKTCRVEVGVAGEGRGMRQEAHQHHDPQPSAQTWAENGSIHGGTGRRCPAACLGRLPVMNTASRCRCCRCRSRR